ncbi:MAG: hypothetical protein LBE36_13570 [Flavobacteriaceae bacterium]|jgi:hypothetical protein|nr:hypothetical protein [Flavobacteriaceae bacterium]
MQDEFFNELTDFANQSGESTNTKKDNTSFEDTPAKTAETNNVETSEQLAPAQETDNNPQPQTAVEPKTDFATEEVAEYNRFVANSGKGMKEYLELKTPTNDLDPKELLKQYYSEKENKGEKEIALELKKMEVPEKGDDDDFELDDTLSEEERLSREVKFESELKKAREWREGKVNELLGTSESPKSENQTETQQFEPAKKYSLKEYEDYAAGEYQKLLNANRQKVYESVGEVKSIPISIAEIKVDAFAKNNISALDFQFTPDDSFSSELRTTGEDLGRVINDFFENGQLKNTKEYLTQSVWWHESTRNRILESMIKQAVLQDRISRDKIRRNVGTDNYQQNAASSERDGAEAVEQFLEETGSFQPFG